MTKYRMYFSSGFFFTELVQAGDLETVLFCARHSYMKAGCASDFQNGGCRGPRRAGTMPAVARQTSRTMRCALWLTAGIFASKDMLSPLTAVGLAYGRKRHRPLHG